MRQTKAVRELGKLRAPLAVTDHHEVNPWSEPHELSGRLEEDLVRLDRDEPRDDSDQRHVLREAQLRSELATQSLAVEEATEVEPQRYHLQLVAAADAQLQKILPDRRAHGEQPVRAFRQPALDRGRPASSPARSSRERRGHGMCAGSRGRR